jgi:hypothetical protein
MEENPKSLNLSILILMTMDKKINLIHAVLVLALLVGIGFAALAVAQSGQAGTTLTSSVTVNTTWIKEFTWTIEKSAAPTELNMFRGDSAASNYTISLTKDGVQTASSLEARIV